MAIKRIPDGKDFEFPTSFGFHPGNKAGAPPRRDTPDAFNPGTPPNRRRDMPDAFNPGEPPNRVFNPEMESDSQKQPQRYEGTLDDDMPMSAPGRRQGTVDNDMKMARGGSVHPHGNDIVGEEYHAATGGRVCHMAHGGFTVHHPNGRVTHHMVDGRPAASGPPRGIEGQHDRSEFVHRGKPSASDPSEPDDDDIMGLARGGRMPGLPRGMKPPIARRRAMIGSETPSNRPPKHPQMTRTPVNDMPGGVMPYGVQPGTEADPAGSDLTGPGTDGASGGALSQLKRGGKVR